MDAAAPCLDSSCGGVSDQQVRRFGIVTDPMIFDGQAGAAERGDDLRHRAQAKTVTIRLEGVNSLTRLQIADDGIGIPRPEPGDGAGLRIMRYRATSIGASLSVERGATGGTVVTCTLVEPPMSARNTV